MQKGQDTDEDPVRKEIKKDMNELFAELDFLTYDTTVNQKEIEIKVISDTPALRSEEIGPSLVSTYSSMAPEEIDGKARGAFMDKSERSATDIKRHRRKVKSKIKARKEAGKEITFKKPKTKVKEYVLYVSRIFSPKLISGRLTARKLNGRIRQKFSRLCKTRSTTGLFRKRPPRKRRRKKFWKREKRRVSNCESQ